MVDNAFRAICLLAPLTVLPREISITGPLDFLDLANVEFVSALK